MSALDGLGKTGRPCLLDLYCAEGGGAAGYDRAGFMVVGVDRTRQYRYPFAFIEADVLDLDVRFFRGFDLVHASPPCQFATALKHAPNAKRHPNLIPATRALLQAAGVPYVIENVEMAREHLINPVKLCGSMFGLGARAGDTFYQLQRHRLFEASFPLTQPECAHSKPVIGMYGGHVRCRAASHGGRRTRDFEGIDKPALAREAMGIDWMTMGGMSQAIPPAYTQWIGRQFLSWRAGAAQQEAA